MVYLITRNNPFIFWAIVSKLYVCIVASKRLLIVFFLSSHFELETIDLPSIIQVKFIKPKLKT